MKIYLPKREGGKVGGRNENVLLFGYNNFIEKVIIIKDIGLIKYENDFCIIIKTLLL